ncbi:beta-glucosidase 24-like [Humulus lupulus]|uniref:beta-glucosidase 24-like n=1 Tax=Humulus lupulus TaxID=3486 RepID=UPI002B413BD1|nr:beta-glucosidase 24-like [Humulus lupulus]
MAFSVLPVQLVIMNVPLSFLGSFVVALLISAFYTKAAALDDLSIKRSDFPKDFLFGAATSAQQIEGSGNEGGRTPSIWDTYAAIPGNIRDGNNTLIATDSYKRYKEDIKLLKDLGVDSYRFSISWSRILPQGSLSGGINQEGIDFYNNLIDELIANGLKPFVTILHFDTPQALEDKYGSFLSRQIVNDFKDYSELLFKTYGDRVKHWVTINEPFVVALGYDLGKGAPGRCSLPPPAGPCPAGDSSIEPYIVGHNFVLAHAAAAKLYKQKYQAQQGGQIGIVVVGEFMEPLNNTPEDKAAAGRYLEFLFGWHLEPLTHGDYPKVMREYVGERLPTFTLEERNLVKGSLDFIGVNYYTSRYAFKSDKPEEHKHYIGDSLVTLAAEKNGVLIGPKSEGNRYVYSYPLGLQKVLEYMKMKYQNPTIYITENGYPDGNIPERPLKESLKDPARINYILQHLYYTNKAMKSGVNVKGYFYWALLDNFEWGSGYTVRYGLYFVDYSDNRRRYPKLSALWLPTFLKGSINKSAPKAQYPARRVKKLARKSKTRPTRINSGKLDQSKINSGWKPKPNGDL